MRISSYINSVNINNELNSLNQLLGNAQVRVTFWGKRVVTAQGYRGSFSIDKIANKVLLAAELRRSNDDFTTAYRVAGLDVMYKLRDFYEVSDTNLRTRNWFTKLITKVREFSFFPYTPRFHTEELGLMSSYFRGYNEQAFIQEFRGVRLRDGGYSQSDGSFGPPLRVAAREELIREKLNLENPDLT